MPDKTGDKTQDQLDKFTIKVDGQDVEVTKDEMIELAQKGKDYTKKTQSLAEQEKALKEKETQVSGLKAIVDEMEANPKLKETLNKVYTDFKSGKISKSETAKDRDLKKLDKLIEDTSDPAQREQLRDIREIIREEAPTADIKTLKDTISALKDEVSILKNATLIGQTDRVDSQLVKLENKFGADLVNKYKKDIQAMALKYPRQSIQKLFYHFADDSEIETAILNQAKRKEKEELDRKKKGSSPSGIDGSFTAKTELKKDKTGRTTFDSIKQRVLERLGKA